MRAPRFLEPLIVAMLALSTSQAAGSRTHVVLSDLSMGMGRDRSGTWQPYEDFRWPTELASFLEAIDAEGGGAADLILNGDTFQLLQSTAKDCVYPDVELGCTESEALARLDRVLSAHDAEIRALSQFARTGSNRVVLVPGERDAALMFPAVGRRIVTALDAPAGRVELATSGYWLSPDGRIYAEHGHQIGFSPHRFDRWPSPFARRGSQEHLVRPWGEQAVQDLYNRYEQRYPIVDNIAEAGLGVKYALAAEGRTDTQHATPNLLKYFLLKMAYQQFRLTDFTEGEPPVYDLVKVRAEGPAFLVGSLPDDDPFKAAASDALNNGRLTKAMAEYTDDELVAICDYHRGAVRRARRRMEPLSQFPEDGLAVPECPRTPETKGPAFEYFWRTRDLVYTRHLAAIGERLRRTDRPIEVLVHGHTLLSDRSQALYNQLVPQGFSPVRRSTTPIVINGGAWQRTITPLQLDRIKTERRLSYDDLLRSLRPEDLAPCYSFVQINPYNDAPAPFVRYWRQAKTGKWEFVETCGR